MRTLNAIDAIRRRDRGGGPADWAASGSSNWRGERRGSRVCVLRRLRGRRAHPVRRGDGPIAIGELFADWKAWRATEHAVTEDRFYISRGSAIYNPHWCCRSASSRRLYIVSLATGALAGPAGEARTWRSFPLRRAEVLYDEAGAVRAWPPQHGDRKDGQRPPVPAAGTARQVHAVRRGRARPPRKQVIRKYALTSRDRRLGIGIKEGGSSIVEARARPGAAQRRLPLDTHLRGASCTTSRTTRSRGPGGRLGTQPYWSRSRNPALQDAPDHRASSRAAAVAYGARQSTPAPAEPRARFPAAR